MNNLDYDHIPVPIERDSGIIVERSKTKIEAICKNSTTDPKLKKSVSVSVSESKSIVI